MTSFDPVYAVGGTLGAALLALCGCLDSGLVHCTDGTVCGAGLICAEGRADCVDPAFCSDVADGDDALCDGVTFAGGACVLGECVPVVCGDDEPRREECDDGNLLSHDGCSSGCLAEQPRWTGVSPEGPSFANRTGVRIVYDARRAEVLLFGGLIPSDPVPRGDTWRWDGVSWTDVTPSSSSPPPRHQHAMAHDASRDRVVLFGGSPPPLDDTWEWDGFAWRDVTPSTSPSSRSRAAMVYDRSRARVLLFGGFDYATSAPLADTWEWDGSVWTDVTPATGSPPARFGHAMAYDAARERVVLFGGGNATTRNDETWEWDGTSWIEVAPAASSPRQRLGHEMVYDALRGRVVVFGGQDLDVLDDTWEWDGANWTEPDVSARPDPRVDLAMAYDAVRGQVLVVGGDPTPNDPGLPIWQLRYTSATPDEACRTGTDADRDARAGCADPDCWAFCAPSCPPRAPCDPDAPRCGDGTCNTFLETEDNCPVDCP